MTPLPPRHTLFPYTTLFRSGGQGASCPFPIHLREESSLADLARSARWSLPVDRAQRCRTLGSMRDRSEEQRLNSSHSQISYAVFCLKKKQHMDLRMHHDVQ